jgi:hypothetical protein
MGGTYYKQIGFVKVVAVDIARKEKALSLSARSY